MSCITGRNKRNIVAAEVPGQKGKINVMNIGKRNFNGTTTWKKVRKTYC
jgi:hypothetical protein